MEVYEHGGLAQKFALGEMVEGDSGLAGKPYAATPQKERVAKSMQRT
jgi:hypothetical protein